jgi:hypothetical protein
MPGHPGVDSVDLLTRVAPERELDPMSRRLLLLPSSLPGREGNKPSGCVSQDGAQHQPRSVPGVTKDRSRQDARSFKTPGTRGGKQ